MRSSHKLNVSERKENMVASQSCKSLTSIKLQPNKCVFIYEGKRNKLEYMN